MKMTRPEDYLKELEEMLQTISTQRWHIADTRKELAVLKNLKIIDKGFKAVLQEEDFLLSRIENDLCARYIGIWFASCVGECNLECIKS
jgi:hypothetical protein